VRTKGTPVLVFVVARAVYESYGWPRTT